MLGIVAEMATNLTEASGVWVDGWGVLRQWQ